MTTTPIFEMDLYADWILCLREALDKAGFPEQVNRNDEHIRIDYFRVVQRQISTEPRKVVKSKDFTCPPEYETGLKMLEMEISKGQNLNPRLSRQMRHLLSNDNMLNDWGFHHFHLGEKPIVKVKAYGMIEGTSDLVFAKIKSDTVYFIRVMGHNQWSNEKVFEVVKSEWPELLTDSELKVQINFDMSTKDREMMREKGIVVPTQTADGRVFLSPGGGYSSDKTSIDAVMRSDEFSRMLRDIEEEMQKEYERASKVGSVKSLPKSICLRVVNQEIVLVNEHGTIVYESGVEVPPLLPFKVQINP